MKEFLKCVFKQSGILFCKMVGIVLMGGAIVELETSVISVILFFIGFALIDLTPSYMRGVWKELKRQEAKE